jgi:hypothetical protein
MKVLRFFLVFVFFVGSISAYSQKDIIIPVNQRVILNYADYTVYAEVMTVDNKIKPSDELYYYWFSANDIKRTRGGFDGKLLHGSYTEFYLNKNLKEKGEFRYGLKNKEWKSWHINGEYNEISNWKKGKRKGKYRLFDKNGNLTEEGNYKDDQLNGKVIKYKSAGGFVVEKYKNGELKTKKERKKIFGKKNRKPKAPKKSKIDSELEQVNPPVTPTSPEDKEVHPKKKHKVEKEPKVSNKKEKVKKQNPE